MQRLRAVPQNERHEPATGQARQETGRVRDCEYKHFFCFFLSFGSHRKKTIFVRTRLAHQVIGRRASFYTYFGPRNMNSLIGKAGHWQRLDLVPSSRRIGKRIK